MIRLMRRLLSHMSSLAAPLAALLTLGALAAPHPGYAADPTPAGHYFLKGMREVGSELVLHPDGRFEYMLAYGAYDEHATGTWQLKDRQVILNSAGDQVPPRFALKQSKRDAEPVLTIQVLDANGQGMAGIDVLVAPDGNEGYEGYTQTYGYRVTWEQATAPRLVALGIKMYQVDWQPFRDLPPTHNHFVFSFDPGTLGQASFRDLAFDWDGNNLTVVRNGQRMRYERR